MREEAKPSAALPWEEDHTSQMMPVKVSGVAPAHLRVTDAITRTQYKEQVAVLNMLRPKTLTLEGHSRADINTDTPRY